MWKSALTRPEAKKLTESENVVYVEAEVQHNSTPHQIQRDPHPGVRVVPCSRIKRSSGFARVRASNTERHEAEVETIECKRCGPDKPKLVRPPFRTDLGEKIQERICSQCWADWLQHQTLLINHYGLDPREAKAKEFLYGQIETVLLGGGEGEQVDTSKQGEIEW